ncbi:MAG TPA: c(7)-type cytochrome triheme domain-containing protein [Sulfuricaulis sp.]|nr:c(7)-type cytochrome triheme domain-containing protein [Sulfuricaulis sp.]
MMRAPLLMAFFMVLTLVAFADTPREWRKLPDDGLHDPRNPALDKLQNPSEALRVLPPDTAGNQVNWVKALREGLIQPRTQLQSTTPMRMLDSEVLMTDTGELPFVRFPHRAHTEWLDCGNCHEKLFKSQAGANPVNMFAILQGEYCGRCHGAVAFPLTECSRCHSVPRVSRRPGTPAR